MLQLSRYWISVCCDGRRYLESAIGTDNFVESFDFRLVMMNCHSLLMLDFILPYIHGFENK